MTDTSTTPAGAGGSGGAGAGEKGLKGGSLAILGSTAYKLLHRSPIPVLVVPAPG